MASSSVLEYEIGVLIAQALDKVGNLVTLNGERIDMHTTIATRSPQSLNMVAVQAVLDKALNEAFARRRISCATSESDPSSTIPNGTGNSTSTRLTTHQLQELGATFGRDPSILRPVVQGMWHSGDGCPDVASVVTRSSTLLAV